MITIYCRIAGPFHRPHLPRICLVISQFSLPEQQGYLSVLRISSHCHATMENRSLTPPTRPFRKMASVFILMPKSCQSLIVKLEGLVPENKADDLFDNGIVDDAKKCV